MPRTTRFSIAKPDIVKFFEGESNKVFTRSKLEKILLDRREFWRLTKSMTVNQFIKELLKHTKLQKTIFEFPLRKDARFSWGEASIYEVVLSLRPKSHFSHYTAVYLHELTEQIPKTIYLNQEQSPPFSRETKLLQKSIDAAFKRPVRISNEIATCGDYSIRILHGMNINRLGIIDKMGYAGEILQVTDVERTLIDIAVRPIYSGGVFEVLKAYQLAKDKVSINRLAAMLKKLNYVYPYHQAIGFYLERAGVYKDSTIQLLRKFPIEYDFYLDHSMPDMDYSKEWRLFFPKGL